MSDPDCSCETNQPNCPVHGPGGTAYQDVVIVDSGTPINTMSQMEMKAAALQAAATVYAQHPPLRQENTAGRARQIKMLAREFEPYLTGQHDD